MLRYIEHTSPDHVAKLNFYNALNCLERSHFIDQVAGSDSGVTQVILSAVQSVDYTLHAIR
jgi:hypothetical protein